MYCEKCGSELSNDAVFCKNCGARTEAEANVQNSVQQVPYVQNMPVNNMPNAPKKKGNVKVIIGIVIAVVVLAVAAVVAVSIYSGAKKIEEEYEILSGIEEDIEEMRDEDEYNVDDVEDLRRDLEKITSDDVKKDEKYEKAIEDIEDLEIRANVKEDISAAMSIIRSARTYYITTGTVPTLKAVLEDMDMQDLEAASGNEGDKYEDVLGEIEVIGDYYSPADRFSITLYTGEGAGDYAGTYVIEENEELPVPKKQ